MNLLSQAAQQSNPSYVVPIVTVLVSGFVALVVGFGAASLKHKWDVQDDKRRWERERAERRREELKAAFGEYLDARHEAERSAVRFLLTGKPGDSQLRDAIGLRLTHSLGHLRILLDPTSSDKVKQDFDAFSSWLLVAASWPSGTEEIPAPPSDETVRTMAQLLHDS